MALANIAKHALKKKLGNKRLFYVCRDAERAEAGLLIGLKNFFILTNNSPLAKELKKKHANILIIKAKRMLDTHELLPACKVIKKGDFIMVFKPTERIEQICAERGWILLNPPAKLANKVEEKISQVAWLGELKKLLPLIKIDILKNIRWGGKKFILQFNRAHTGSGTMLIDGPKKLNKLKKQFPERDARVSRFVDGPIFTVNCAVGPDKILFGNISYQITGLAPFTDNKFATIGNDWNLPGRILNKKQINKIKNIAGLVGKRMSKSGWRGLFGIDAVADKKTGRVYLLEINARQPASTSCESILQNKKRTRGSLTIFEAHLLALFNVKAGGRIININDGAQIIQRVTADTPRIFEPNLFRPVYFRYIQYENSKSDSDLLRMQTGRSVMQKHNELNEVGNELSIFARFEKRNEIFGRPRAGAVVLNKDNVLLLKRHRYGYNYWAIPGGRTERGETMRMTAVREILEETGLRVTLDLKRKPLQWNGNRKEIYYFVKSFTGRPKLGGPEKAGNHKANHYTLKWVPIKNIKKINLLPPELKEKLIKIL